MASTQGQVRVRNDGDVVQIVTLAGNPIRVVPRGTALLPEGSPFVGVAGFTIIERIKSQSAPAPVDDSAALRAQVEALTAELAAARAVPPEATQPEARPESDDEPYPRHHKGGKWYLSDGTLTAGGLSREAAVDLEAALHAAE